MLQNGALKFKLNEPKSVNTTFFLRQGFCPYVTFNGIKIQHFTSTKYLSITFYKGFT